ncbi:MAG: hypothetical protein Q4C61_03400 [Lachnospiraceae bacterium]|nr:hypothetical protein [Lachnospiraceae bacterium]
MDEKVAAKANLITLLDNTYPGVNKLFGSPAREDGSENPPIAEIVDMRS